MTCLVIDLLYAVREVTCKIFLIVVFYLQSDKDFDPFADRRRQTIAEKEDEYRQKRRKMIISPERVDPFADGEC